MDARNREKIFELFTQLSILKSFSTAEIKDTFFKRGLAKVVEYSPGDTIIDEGKYDNWVYWLIEGRIDVIKNGVSVAFFERIGDMFGEMGILEGDARSASVFARTKTVCLTIDMSILEHPDLKDKISQEVFCRDIAQVTKDRLAKTTFRLSETEQQLAETEQSWKETMATLKKTLERLEEKDMELASLKQSLDQARQEAQRLEAEKNDLLSFIKRTTGRSYEELVT